MNYYLINNSTNLIEVGHYVQTKGLPVGYTYNWLEQENSIAKLTNDAYPIEDTDFIWDLEDDALLTDVISTSNISCIGLLVSDKFRKYLGELITHNHRFYPAKVRKKNIVHSYYWLHFVKKDLDGVDLKKSVFFKSNFGFDIGERLFFDSYKTALKIMRKEDCFIKLGHLHLLKNNIELYNQLFYLPVPNRIIATQKVISRIKKYQLTGIDFNII